MEVSGAETPAGCRPSYRRAVAPGMGNATSWVPASFHLIAVTYAVGNWSDLAAAKPALVPTAKRRVPIRTALRENFLLLKSRPHRWQPQHGGAAWLAVTDKPFGPILDQVDSYGFGRRISKVSVGSGAGRSGSDPGRGANDFGSASSVAPPSPHEPIPHLPHGDDMRRLRRIVLELSAQLGDM